MSGPSFPLEDPRPAGEQKTRYLRFTDDRLGDAAYHYAVTIPQDFRDTGVPREAPTLDRTATYLGSFRGPGPDAVSLDVSAHLISREMAPADWLEAFVGAADHQILKSRRIHTPGGDVLDALTEGPGPGGAPVVSRWLSLKDSTRDGQAARVLTAEARVRRGAYEQSALDMMWATTQLQIVNPSNWPLAELLRSYTAGRPGDFVFLYPMSWSLSEIHADETLTGVRAVELVNEVGKATLGRIAFVCSGSARDPRELLDAYLRSLASRGILTDLGGLMDAPPFGGLARAWAAIGRGHDRVDDQGHPFPPQSWPFDPSRDPYTRREPAYDVQVRIGQRERAFYLVGLLGVTRAKHLAFAGINRRAYDIVLETMRTERAG